MSRLCCHDNANNANNADNANNATVDSGGDDWPISEEEIQNVIKESQDKDEDKKPSTADLFQRIDDLEFELECIRADNELQRKHKVALQRLLAVVDLSRFEEKNKAYVKAILAKIKHLLLL